MCVLVYFSVYVCVLVYFSVYVCVSIFLCVCVCYYISLCMCVGFSLIIESIISVECMYLYVCVVCLFVCLFICFVCRLFQKRSMYFKLYCRSCWKRIPSHLPTSVPLYPFLISHHPSCLPPCVGRDFIIQHGRWPAFISLQQTTNMVGMSFETEWVQSTSLVGCGF